MRSVSVPNVYDSNILRARDQLPSLLAGKQKLLYFSTMVLYYFKLTGDGGGDVLVTRVLGGFIFVAARLPRFFSFS